VAETLEQVRSQDPTPPSRLAARVPRDLETICLKCLRKEPARRYASAAELAEDLEHFVQGKSIRARRASAAEQLLLRARRRPVVAGLSGALVLAVAALVVVAVRSDLRTRAANRALGEANDKLSEALRREQAEHASAQENRKRAEKDSASARRSRDLALGAAKTFYRRVCENDLVTQPHMIGLRNQLLAHQIAFYDAFVRHARGDAELQVERGRAYWQLGQLTSEIGSQETALERLHQGRDLLAKLGQTAEVKRLRTRIGIDVANILCSLGRAREAEPYFQESLRIESEITKGKPDAESLYQQALTWKNLGVTYLEQDRLRQAGQALGRALRAARELYERDKRRRLGRCALCIVQVVRIPLLSRRERFDDAEAAYCEARDLAASLQGAEMIAQERRVQAEAEVQFAQACLLAGRLEEARKGFERGLEFQDRLIREQPELQHARHLRAETLNKAASLHVLARRWEEARKLFVASSAECERLCLDHPAVIEYRMAHGKSLAGLAWMQQRTGGADEGIATMHRAIRALETIDGRLPQAKAAREFIARNSALRALWLVRARRLTEAVADFDRVVELRGERELTGEDRLWYAAGLAKLGRHARAEEVVGPLFRGAMPPPARYNGACVLALCAKASLADPALPLPVRLKRADQLGAAGVRHLRRVADAGYFAVAGNGKLLTADEDLEPLHGRIDFQALRRETARREREGVRGGD
jgi:serine/threonine-protein kinase